MKTIEEMWEEWADAEEKLSQARNDARRAKLHMELIKQQREVLNEEV
jgi:hypothetical protein